MTSKLLMKLMALKKAVQPLLDELDDSGMSSTDPIIGELTDNVKQVIEDEEIDEEI